MPLEGLGITVALVEIIEHRHLQMAHSGVAAALDAPLDHFCEQRSTRLSQLPLVGVKCT